MEFLGSLTRSLGLPELNRGPPVRDKKKALGGVRVGERPGALGSTGAWG